MAPLLCPAWQGGRDMALSLSPDPRVADADVFFPSGMEGGFNLVRQEGWRAGPLVEIRFGRDENGSGSPFQLTRASEALRTAQYGRGG